MRRSTGTKSRRSSEMSIAKLLFVVIAAAVIFSSTEGKDGLQIGVKKRPETCDMRTKKGDKLSMHYTVSTRNYSDLQTMRHG